MSRVKENRELESSPLERVGPGRAQIAYYIALGVWVKKIQETTHGQPLTAFSNSIIRGEKAAPVDPDKIHTTSLSPIHIFALVHISLRRAKATYHSPKILHMQIARPMSQTFNTRVLVDGKHKPVRRNKPSIHWV